MNLQISFRQSLEKNSWWSTRLGVVRITFMLMITDSGLWKYLFVPFLELLPVDLNKSCFSGVKHPGDHIKFSLLGDYDQVSDLATVCMLTLFVLRPQKRVHASKLVTSRMVETRSRCYGWPYREKILYENVLNRNWKKWSNERFCNKHVKEDIPYVWVLLPIYLCQEMFCSNLTWLTVSDGWSFTRYVQFFLTDWLSKKNILGSNKVVS